MPQEKVPAFLKSHTMRQEKSGKLEKNRFCIPIHLETNRSTFDKFLPLPLLLHPTVYSRENLFEISGTPVRTCSIFWGTTFKT